LNVLITSTSLQHNYTMRRMLLCFIQAINNPPVKERIPPYRAISPSFTNGILYILDIFHPKQGFSFAALATHGPYYSITNQAVSTTFKTHPHSTQSTILLLHHLIQHTIRRHGRRIGNAIRTHHHVRDGCHRHGRHARIRISPRRLESNAGIIRSVDWHAVAECGGLGWWRRENFVGCSVVGVFV